jgi:hypothetical protein
MPKLFGEEFKTAQGMLSSWRLDNPDSDLTWEMLEEFLISRILWVETDEDNAEPFVVSTESAYWFTRMEHYRNRLPVELVSALTGGN